MPRQKPSTRPPLLDSQVLKFVSRAEQLRLRGRRNYDRYMLVTKGFVDADGPERRRWHQESAEDSARDAEWNRRHGRVPAGARILQWSHKKGSLPMPRKKLCRSSV